MTVRTMRVTNWIRKGRSLSLSVHMDGCYYPNLRLPEGTHYNIGEYGLMLWGHLKENCRREYLLLLMDGKLNEYLHEVDQKCYARMELLIEQMKAGGRDYGGIKGRQLDEVG